MEKEETERKVNHKFQDVIAETKMHQEIVAVTEISKAIKGMKNNNIGDTNNWKAEWIKEAEDEMLQTQAFLFNSIKEEKKISTQ